MTKLTKITSLLSAAVVAAIAPSFLLAQVNSLSLDDVVSRMQQARSDYRDAAVAYTVTREYELAAADAQKPQSDVVADINVLAPSQEQYAILKTEGNDRGQKIVRKILDHETSMAAHRELSEISPRNYDLALLGTDTVDGHPCYKLQLTPKREAVELLRGTAWVDADTFALRRLDGSPAKNPSMWVKNLHITVNYGNMNGVWLQTSTRAVAEVRLAGTHVLTSRATDLRTASITAQARPLTRRSNPRRAIANSGVWVAR